MWGLHTPQQPRDQGSTVLTQPVCLPFCPLQGLSQEVSFLFFFSVPLLDPVPGPVLWGGGRDNALWARRWTQYPEGIRSHSHQLQPQPVVSSFLDARPGLELARCPVPLDAAQTLPCGPVCTWPRSFKFIQGS